MPEPLPCPACQKPRDAKLRCWRCNTRPCSACGRGTGSAFIQLCIICGQRDTAAEVRAPAPEPDVIPLPAARRWLAIFEPEPGDVPVAVRMRQILKYAKRQQGMRCVCLPNDVPDEAKTEEPVEE